MISGGVHAGVFVLQFMEWWYSDSNRENMQKVSVKFTVNRQENADIQAVLHYQLQSRVAGAVGRMRSGP